MKTMSDRPTQNGVRYTTRRRAPDAFERVLAAVLGAAFVASLLVALAIGAGAVWLIIVIIQDVARRLG